MTMKLTDNDRLRKSLRLRKSGKILAMLLLGVALVIGAGCGSGDTPTDPETGDSPAAIPTGRLSGQVGKIDGIEISIRVLQDGKVIASTQADAAGNYQIDKIEPGTYTVKITAKGYETTDLTVQIIANQVTSLDKVGLKALGILVANIRGFLSDQATKKALKDVRVQLIDEFGNIRDTLTSATGGFEFENVPAHRQFTLIVAHDTYERQEIKVDPIAADETAKLTIELVPVQRDELPVGDGLTVGTKAPDFSLPDGDGKIHALADYAGQKVLLVFDRGQW